jgi:hypothetical protein
MRRRSVGRRAWPVAVAVAALATGAVAMAATLTAGTPVRVPDKPLAGSPACAPLVAQQTALGSVNFPDSEVEPYVAADPTNPLHLVGSFQQDRWNDGGSNGLTNVVSTDGGATWSLAASQPQFSRCAGAPAGSPGDFSRATDPWVSFSSDGRIVYSISDSFNANGPAFGGASSIVISRSTDGGTTWQTPVTARVDISTTVLNDKETVTADPTAPLTAYAIWDRLVSPSTNANPGAFDHSPAFRGPVLFSKTTDGGVSWSNGRVIFDPGEKNQTIGNQIVVPTAGPAAGTLVDGFDLIQTKGGLGNNQRETFSVAVIRSADGGATWSQPTIVAQQDFAGVSIAGHAVRSSDELPEFATGPNGNLYAVWQDGRFTATGAAKVAFSMSSDGGLTWTTPIRVDQSPGDTPSFTPQVHVASDGTVGVSYYDLESATTAQPGLTDTFIVHCHATCVDPASWAAGGETKLDTSGPFDMTQAPDAGGYFTGDYQGLTASASTFDPFFVQAAPQATAGLTDTFANTAS